MSADNSASRLSTSDPRRGGFTSFMMGSFLLSQDDNPPPLSPHGQGALAHLLRSRSYGSLHNYGSTWRGPIPNGPDDEEAALLPPSYARSESDDEEYHRSSNDERRLSQLLNSNTMRSMRLIGKSNPRYKWGRYWKTEEELNAMRKPLREYYERTNYLVQQYIYIDRLLDSSLPHDLVNEYNELHHSSFKDLHIPTTISEEQSSSAPSIGQSNQGSRQGFDESVGSATPITTFSSPQNAGFILNEDADGNKNAVTRSLAVTKVKRTPKNIYRATETTPLFLHNEEEDDEWDGPKPEIPWLEEDEELDSGDSIVTTAIYVNFTANVILLAGKIAVVISVSSMSVLASLVDAVLDFLSTVIVWTTTWLISRQDQYKYPVGRRKLEPLGVLVFSVIMITSFVQVALESIQRLAAPDHEIIEVGIPALSIMFGTVLIKGLCWIWCRLVKNSSVQALAEDAMTDVIFNMGSILFPIVGFYAKIWWLDALGGLILSLVVIFNWSRTSLQHIKNLTGFSATADQRNILLYLAMRFANTIKQIQGLQAYHAGDKLNVEVDIILDASTTLRDSHDLCESLGYVLESVPIVDRAFVHADYASYNLPTHMEQQSG
ncbi:hypothetical protein F4804DRAFT_4227 [Jackrogersella minutella]|nr:hypothetical protein F4804DRAFT_4227 [Jackrogersella minutella]